MKTKHNTSDVVRITIGTIALATSIALQGVPGPAYAAEPAAALRTGAYTYAGHGTVNTHWIETRNGIIVIDVQRDLGHAKEALAAVKRLKKPVLAVFVSHAHPDHYAGVGIFKDAFPNAATWSSKLTLDTIRKDHYGFNKLALELAKGNFPDPVVLPDLIFKDNDTLTIDGVRIVTREMGQAESNGATVFYLPATGDLYPGDLVLNRMHGFFNEGATLANLAVLDRMRTLFPLAKTLHPGHGTTGPVAEILARHREYILSARQLTADALARQENSSGAQRKVMQALQKRYPSFGIPGGQPDMLEVSVKGLFQELAAPEQLPVK